MEVQPGPQDPKSIAPTVVDPKAGQNSVTAYQSTTTASTYYVPQEANAPQYVTLSSSEK
jgi:hypothetical protein